VSRPIEHGESADPARLASTDRPPCLVASIGEQACHDHAVPAVCLRTRLDACPRTVAGVLRDADTAVAALAREGHRMTADRRLLLRGDELRIQAHLGLGFRVPLCTTVTAVSSGGIASSLVSGPLRRWEHVVSLAVDGASTEVHDEVRWSAPLGRALDPLLLRTRLRGLLAARARELTTRVDALAAGPVIVATAIIRDGRVLAAQRTRPSTVAGRWELPGGRVEAGEPEEAAVARECAEELGAHVRPTGRLGTDLPIDAGALRVHLARLAPDSAEPQALEHAALRWLGATELDTVDWIDADRAVLPELAVLLGA
jgi:8-oxo-dGTP diphosphatase